MNLQKTSAQKDTEILIVEDSPTQAEWLNHLLSQEGYAVTVAANGKQALAAAHQHKPGLVISDVVMPEMDGYTLCKEIKSQAEMKDIPVILVTSLSSPQDIIKGLECGADNFIRKPYDENYLLSRIDFVLTNRDLRETDKLQMGIEIYFGGQKHYITSERKQILDLLISTYEEAIQLNGKLEEKQKELRRTAEDLVRAKEEAERANRFKDQFLSMMSHELRTPLNAILGFSELLSDERYGPLTDRQNRYVANIHNGGRHLLRIINDILDLSRIQAGHLELAFESVPIDIAFAEILTTMQPLAEKKSQMLSQSVEPSLAVRADAMRFKQVLMNLVGNAIKFTPEGGRIELTAHQADKTVRVEVRDTGPGIPPEEQKRVFEAFHRLRQSGKAIEGTGLGLAITQRLVELQDGQLGLDSQPGQGSIFYFCLPVAPAVPKALAREVESGAAASTPPRVLVIEENDTAGQLIHSQLTSSGYEVLVCNQLQRAVEMTAEFQPHAITLNPLTKETDGWQVLAQLKRDPRTANIPVIVITIVDHPVVAALLGADECLVKPVDRHALLAAVDRHLATYGSTPPALRPILVVEDDKRTRELITELLTAQGYAVATAVDGAQADAQVVAALPELVILDLLLPKMSGFELLAKWRASPRTADLPVFVLTSKDLTRDEEKYLRAHAESLFLKKQPWQEALVNQLNRVLARSQPKR